MKNKKENKRGCLLIGTNNPGKFKEIKEILSDLNVKCIMPKEIGISTSPEETGSTHLENAKIKAEFFYKQSGGMPTLAEDSGIEVEFFKNQLGHKTRRWGKGEKANDRVWLNHFLKEMEKAPSNKRNAEFKCCAVLILKGKQYVFNGSCKGKITRGAEAPILKGLPLSSCFKPNGLKKVYAALSTKEKNLVSHRGKAIRKAKVFLKKHLAQKGF